MQRDQAWAELVQLSLEWLDHDADDAEPWRLLGTAFEQLDRLDDARDALQCALRLAPSHAALNTQLLALRGRSPSARSNNDVAACTAQRR